LAEPELRPLVIRTIDWMRQSVVKSTIADEAEIVLADYITRRTKTDERPRRSRSNS
jgi:hypothetical protein